MTKTAQHNPFTAPKAYSYLRFSTPEQMRGDSFRRQTQLAEEYAVRHGLDLDTSLTFQDLGISGFRGRNVEAGKLGEFLEAVRAGLVERGSYLLVESLDRLSRQSARKALRTLESICDEGITVVTMADGREYTEAGLDEDPTSLLMSILIFMRANEESATKARRLQAAWSGKRIKATEGTPITSRCPGWLKLREDRSGFDVLEDRAAIVRRIYSMTLDGVGKHGIAQRLNQEGVQPFGRGAMWHRSYVQKILENPAVIGTAVPHEMIGRNKRKPLDPIPNYFPAIISEEDFQRVQAIQADIASPLRGRHASAELHNIFGGLLRCPVCGSTMLMTNKGKKSCRRLVCRRAKSGAGCEYRSVLYSDFEEAFLRDLDRLIETCPSGSESGRELEAQIENLDAGITALEGQLENLLEAIAGGRKSAAVMDRIAKIEADMEAAKAERDGLVSRLTATSEPLLNRKLGRLEETLAGEELDREAVNTRLRELLSAVVVDYPNGRGVLVWKHGGENAFQFAMPMEEGDQD